MAEPGIYVLLSDRTENAGLTKIYIGETDDFMARIVDHARKDWWDRFVVFVSKDKNLTKAHVRFLEREFHQLAGRSVGSLDLVNEKEPGGASLPESDRSAMSDYVDQICFVLETLGLGNFTNRKLPATPSKPIAKEHAPNAFYISLPQNLVVNGEPAQGQMIVEDGRYILQPGSFIRKEARESFQKHDSYYTLWQTLVSSSAVESSTHPELLVVISPIEFRSPSAAGAVVRAGSTNGRTEWRRVADNRPLFECELDA